MLSPRLATPDWHLRTNVRYRREMWTCPTHGAVDVEGSEPTCPWTLRRTVAGEPVVEPCGKRLVWVDDDD
jgi:hypothetical protein